MSREFNVYFCEELAGVLTIEHGLRMSFVYDESYIASQGQAISLMMPLVEDRYEDHVVFPYIENLLPEGEVRELIQEKYRISQNNFDRFLDLLGADVAGAIGLYPKGQQPVFEKQPIGKVLTREELSALLLNIQDNPFNIGEEGARGDRLSLAGAQNKLPVVVIGENVYEAQGVPSTHIIKPKRKDNRFPSLVYNEYICMVAARNAGIQVPNVKLLEVYDQEGNESDALLIERYDRKTSKEGTIRLMQEDLCQLNSIASVTKYQCEGGPGFKDLFDAVADYCKIPAADNLELYKRIVFNLVIGNYDAHAKNFSFLTYQDGTASLAPAYDMVCTELYPELKVEFAMFVGNTKELSDLFEESFIDLFDQVGMKYAPMKNLLSGFADEAINGVRTSVSDFISQDYYEADEKAAERILQICESNYKTVKMCLTV